MNGLISMKLVAVRETSPHEKRCILTPFSAKALQSLGWEVFAPRGIGETASFGDDDFETAGVHWIENVEVALEEADLVMRISPPTLKEICHLKPGSIHISFLRPFENAESLAALARQNIRAIALELIPRTTLSQSMDVLSSQSSLAGYAAVIHGAAQIPNILPMMITPAGTIQPARFFILGAGVAGLQAIATAKRLGAIVEAFDARPSVEEQVKSLGARFLRIDLGETGQTSAGYANALSAEQLAKQQKAMARACANADVIITTAKVFGRKSPILIDDEMIRGMKSGSIILDLAVESGGNVVGSQSETTLTTSNGVRIIGLAAAENGIPHSASLMLSANLANLLQYFNSPDAIFHWNLQNEILKSCAVTADGHQLWHQK